MMSSIAGQQLVFRSHGWQSTCQLPGLRTRRPPLSRRPLGPHFAGFGATVAWVHVESPAFYTALVAGNKAGGPRTRCNDNENNDPKRQFQ